MLKAFRVTPHDRVESAFSGEGARKYGGRWNSVGTRVIYCSSTLSLAMLEIIAHLDDYASLMDNYSYVPLDIPGELIEMVQPKQLPLGWNSPSPTTGSQHHGDNWVTENRSVALAVPSVIVPDEYNFVLNPLHPDFGRVVVGQTKRLDVDHRLFK